MTDDPTERYLERRRTSRIERTLRHFRERKILNVIDALQPGEGHTLLEVGASDCTLSDLIARRYPDITVISLDSSHMSLAGRPYGGALRATADARLLPIRSNSIDCIICVSTFKHISKPHLAREEWSRVLKSGGHILIVEPSWWVIWIGGRLGYFELKYAPNVWSTRKYRRFFGRAHCEYVEGYQFVPFDGGRVSRLFPGIFQFFWTRLQ